MSDYIKLFSGTSIIVNRLAQILNELGITSIVKDNHESGRLAGFGTLGQSVDLLINESDYEKASEALEDFKKEFSK
ncbi:putative signal transducing protein [Tenacibaculum jejuense]|uniref:DUF2007 domain-containing protein n=1 Tax=Tenacibaculum jejuense TaxID=584609 RepID=A0A238U4Q8_9FLAO|nr:DUF2007 domain-containing protein [Tenacibaculum jejuense]SNR14025.1 conserved protein of unknown function [Tenacibaculum jejuense]